MAFGKRKSGGGTTPPILKYDARHGALFTEDRVYRDGSWQTEQHDVSRLALDILNAQKGWLLFPKGAAPEMVLFPIDADIGEAPSEDYREGLRILAMVDGEDVVRELLSTALALWRGMDALHTACLAAAADHPGALPVCELVNTREVKNTHGNISFEPVLQIVGWLPRTNMPATAAPRSQPQPKPKPKPKPKRGDMDDEIPF